MPMNDTDSHRHWTRALLAPIAAILALGLAGCEEGLLEVDDPDVVQPDALQGPDAVPIRINGIIGDFHNAYDEYVLYSALLTDEMILAGTFPTRIDVDERIVQQDPDNGTVNADIYEPMHVSRASADEGYAVFQEALGNEEFSEVQAQVRDGIAVARFYGGYQRILFAEGYCQSIFGGPDGESSPSGPDARMEEALAMLQEAETAANEAGLPDLATAARVGQGRALLWLGRYQEAASTVSGVPDDFVFFSEYSGNNTAQYNEVFQMTTGTITALRWTVGDGTADNRHNERWPYFQEWVDQGLLDPDVDLEAAEIGIPVVLQTIYNSPSSNILIASGWEARMIEAEAELRAGNDQVAEDEVNRLLTTPSLNPLTEVNPSLAGSLGSFDTVDFNDSGFDPATDLPQLARARIAGLWLSGQRQATLRRFATDDGVDLYPQDTQGDDMSFPITQQEIDNNRNVNSACGS